ncbi:MAG: hypothetical protein LC122_06170 [Chitinophagales bacterium]|nr:hypothetical protein [Chitinophagales bacterium]
MDSIYSGKKTYLQLPNLYKCSVKTIQRKLDKTKIIPQGKLPREVIVLKNMAYYWGRNFGVMLFKGSLTKENLL